MATDMEKSGSAAEPTAPKAGAGIRVAVFALVATLIGASLYLWAVRGHAVLLDLASSAVAFLCL